MVKKSPNGIFILKILYINIICAGISVKDNPNMTVLHKINCMKFLDAIDFNDSIEDVDAFDNI